MSSHRFDQVDVFTEVAFGGNPVAVVHDAETVDDERMAAIARWTNLAETTFLLPPTTDDADYRVRIFTPVSELPFAGHPTLGSCHAWLAAGGVPRTPDVIVQQCAAGLITVRRDGHLDDPHRRLAFAAPPRTRSGPVAAADLDPVVAAFGLGREQVVDAAWADNGPGWMALLLADQGTVLDVRPGFVDADVGLVARRDQTDRHDGDLEVRAFFPKDGAMIEDPVTGSLNAALAQWLLESGRVEAPYVARQGTALGRTGRVHITVDDRGAVWVGGATTTRVTGSIAA